MKCERCQSAKATVHVTERGASGSFEGHHYCKACCSDIQTEMPALDPVPSREQLTTALIEAGAIAGRHLTPEEAFATVTAFLKSMEQEPPDASAD